MWINYAHSNSLQIKEEAVLIHCFGLSADPALVKEAKALAKEIVKTIPIKMS